MILYFGFHLLLPSLVAENPPHCSLGRDASYCLLIVVSLLSKQVACFQSQSVSTCHLCFLSLFFFPSDDHLFESFDSVIPISKSNENRLHYYHKVTCSNTRKLAVFCPALPPFHSVLANSDAAYLGGSYWGKWYQAWRQLRSVNLDYVLSWAFRLVPLSLCLAIE